MEGLILANIVYLTVHVDGTGIVRGLSDQPASGAEEREIVLKYVQMELHFNFCSGLYWDETISSLCL